MHKMNSPRVPGGEDCNCGLWCQPLQTQTCGLGSILCRGLKVQPAEDRLADTAPNTSDFRPASTAQNLNELPNLVRFSGRN